MARIATSRGNSSGSEGAFRSCRLERPSFSTPQSSPVKTSPNGTSIARQRAAVLSLARTWSADLKEQDIRINAVSPGVIDTPGYRLVGLDETRPSWPAFSAGPPTPPPSGGMEFPAMSQRWSASSPPTTVASSPEAKSSWMEGLPRSDLANQAPIHRRVFECRGDDVPPLRECSKTSPK